MAQQFDCQESLLEPESRPNPVGFASSEKDAKLAQNWANFILLSVYPHSNVRANSHILGQPNTFLA